VDDMVVGRAGDGLSAIMVLTTDAPVPAGALDELRSREGIVSVRALHLR